MNISIDNNDVLAILLSLDFYNAQETTYRTKSQIKLDKKLASKIKSKIKNNKSTLTSDEHHLILLAVVFSYEFFLYDAPTIFAGDIAGLVEAQKHLREIEPVYKKFLPLLDSFDSSDSNDF